MKRLSLLCVSVLALAGCSAGGSAVAPSEVPVSATPSGPVITGQGVYLATVGGASLEVSLPGAPDDVVAGAVAVAKAPKPVYVSVVVDNRNGDAQVMPDVVHVYTVDGAKVSYDAGYKYLNTLDDASLPVAEGNKIIAAFNKVNDPVSVGESRTVTMVGSEPLPDDIVTVTVADAYGEEVQATKG